MKRTVKVAVTGAGGQIGYSLLFRIASGEVFGPDCAIDLRLLEVPAGIKGAEGTAMELEDAAFPTLARLEVTDQAPSAFDGIHWACLVGAKPRGPGMERKDLIRDNAKIFVEQGKALVRAASDVMVVVVGNPCNTNALIAKNNCREIPPTRFTAMTMLDENRARAQIARKAQVGVGDITNFVVWGNHSTTMFPDFENAKIQGRALSTVVTDRAWLEGGFLTTVQKRGAAIIEARGKSSAASAASACIDHMKRFTYRTASGDWFSAAVPSDGNAYGVPAGLVFSFPIRADGNGKYEIVRDVPVSDYAKKKLKATTDELLEEREIVKDLLA